MFSSSIEQPSFEESINTNSTSLTNETVIEAITDDVIPKADKKKKAGEVSVKKKTKKSKKSESEKENISVVS